MKKIALLLFYGSLTAFAGCSSSSTEIAANSANNSAPPVNRIETKTVQINIPIGENSNVNLAANMAAGKPNKDAVSTSGARPAPDNSEIFTELKEEPVETRVFKDHPQLVKVVKSGIPPKQTIKVYLKNGKVVSLAGEKIPNLGLEPAANILQAAGVQPPPAPAGDTRATTKKQ